MAQINTIFTQDAPTLLRGRVLTIMPGQVVELEGGPVGRHRKFIRITNEDVNTRLYVVKGKEQSVDPKTVTEKLAVLGTDDFIELDTNALITLKNISSSENVTPVAILETFYIGAGALVV
jgi:hypothetical protein